MTFLPLKKPANINHEVCKWMVYNLVKKENQLWSREIAIAKKLIKCSDDLSFWEDVAAQFKQKLPSLAFFLTEKGAEILQREIDLKKLVLPEQKRYNLEIEIKSNPKETKKNNNIHNNNTLLQFLKS